MPSTQTHIVARYAMELDFMDRRAAHRGSEELMAASRHHIAAMIDAICSEMVGADVYVTIPRLEIDLGTLDPLHLVDGFLERFKQGLAQQLKAALAAQAQTDPLERAMQVLKDYGTTGQYPWWAGSPDPAILQAAVDTLLRGGTAGTPALCSLLAQGRLLQRLVLALPPRQLAAIWERLAADRQVIAGDAALLAVSRAILHGQGGIDRRRWQEFVYKSILFVLPTAAVAVSDTAILWWLQQEAAVALPPRWAASLRASPELATRLGWLQSCLEAPAALLLPQLLGPHVPPSDAQRVHAAEAAYCDWLKTHWNLGGSLVQAQLAAVQAMQVRIAQAAPQSAATEPSLLAWLRLICRQPDGNLQDLCAQLAAQYVARFPVEAHETTALTAWLRAQPTLPPEAPALLAPVLLPLVIAQGRSLQAAPKPPAMAAADLQPLLGALLHAPHASVQTLLERLATAAARHLAEAEPSADAIAGWLRSRYSLTADHRRQVAEAVSGLLLPQWQPRQAPTHVSSSKLDIWPSLRVLLELPQAHETELIAALQAHFAAAHPTAAHEEHQLMTWLRGLPLPQGSDLQALAAAILQAGGQQRRPAAVQEKHPALVSMLPWLRRKLDLPAADAETILTDLLERYHAAYPGVDASQLLIEQWLDRHLRMPKPKRALTAGAMVRVAQQPKPPRVADPRQASPLPHPPVSQVGAELPYFVENAGLIILWPMLQRCFQFLGLVEDKDFVSVIAQEQAVRLLQTLVMGDEEWNEAALALPKMLCGLAPDALVDPFVEVDAAQLEGIDTLVGAVLAHWTLAGELSVDGFRQAWLQRSGTLRLRDDHWLLRIEARGHDMILEGLPWDIAYIQLPWMRNVLYVDWGDKAKFNA